MWAIVIPLLSIDTLTGSVQMTVHSHAIETNQNITHSRRYTNVHWWWSRELYYTEYVGHFWYAYYIMYFVNASVSWPQWLSVKLGNATSWRNNFCTVSPRRTPNLTSKPLTTLLSVSHVPCLADMLCPSPALCLTWAQCIRNRPLIFYKCWESPWPGPRWDGLVKTTLLLLNTTLASSRIQTLIN